MRTRVATVAVLATLGLAACNGPKDTCQGSYESWQSILKGHDWDAAYELLTPDHKKKAKSPEILGRGMEEIWEGSKSFSFKTIDVVEMKNGLCTASGEMDYTIKIRGKNPEDTTGEYYSWTFRRGKDGKWYIELPGSEKIQAF